MSMAHSDPELLNALLLSFLTFERVSKLERIIMLKGKHSRKCGVLGRIII